MPNPEISEAGVCSSHSTPPQGLRMQHGGPTPPQDQSRDLLPPVQSTLPTLNHKEGLARHIPQRRTPRPKESGTSWQSPESWGPEESQVPKPSHDQAPAPGLQPGEVGRSSGLPLHTKCTQPSEEELSLHSRPEGPGAI